MQNMNTSKKQDLERSENCPKMYDKATMTRKKIKYLQLETANSRNEKLKTLESNLQSPKTRSIGNADSFCNKTNTLGLGGKYQVTPNPSNHYHYKAHSNPFVSTRITPLGLKIDSSCQSFDDESFTDYYSTPISHTSVTGSCHSFGSDHHQSANTGGRPESEKGSNHTESPKTGKERRKVCTLPSDLVNIHPDKREAERDWIEGYSQHEQRKSIDLLTSPWGESHQNVQLPANFFNRDSQFFGGNESGEGVGKEGDACNKFGERQHNCPFCLSSSPTVVHPAHQDYAVFPVFPVYLVNSVESASSSQSGVFDAANRASLKVNVITLPSANFEPVNLMSGRTSAEDRMGRGQSGMKHPSGPAGIKRGDAVSVSGQQDHYFSRTLASDKPTAQQPHFIICYICGRQYGSASIRIHEKQCLEKWKRENNGREIPKKPQRPGPVKPQDGAQFEQNMSQKPGSNEVLVPGKGNYDLDATDKAAFSSDPFSYSKCEKCGRTFLPASLQLHFRNCRGFHKIV